MTPEDVRAALPAPPEPLATLGELPPDKRGGILANITASYFKLRRGMAAIALAFPIVLWLGGGAGRPEASISAYYHADGGRMRDVFVGVLWAIGAFLFFYRGYSRAEDRALDGAGVAALVVSLAPADWPPAAPATPVGRLHAAAALTFFALTAYVSVFRSGDTLRLLRDAARRRRFARTYRLLGLLMLLLPLAALALHALFPAGERSVLVFLTETAGIYVFAAFWLTKSREIAALERQ